MAILVEVDIVMWHWRRPCSALKAIITNLGVVALLVCSWGAISTLSGCSSTQTAGPAVVTVTAATLNMAEATPELTPLPTGSPTSSSTSTLQPTDTPVPATNTPVPTIIPQPTATLTRQPADTPQATDDSSNEAQPPTPTPLPPPPTDTPVPTYTPTPTDTPMPTATPTPTVTWRLVSARQLTPCENRGGNTLFINVIDAAGNGIANVPLLVEWDSGSQVIYTGQKMERGPGWAEYPMYGGYTVRVNDGTSDVTPMLSSHLPDSQRCDETNDNVANSFGHYSYEVVFQRTY